MVQRKQLILALAVLAVASLFATARAENRKLLQDPILPPGAFGSFDEELRDYLSDRATDFQPFDIPGSDVPVLGGFLSNFWDGIFTLPATLGVDQFAPGIYEALG
mmetsp:Transcript_16913/g.34627  ORF Transcript_16913/g.34627 Transcript_16913/m.34627 type:complete len:105 (-) Transcript_16913:330-644(-)